MTVTFDQRLSAEPAALRALRRGVRTALRGMRLQPNDIDTVLLVLDELVSNAIEHGAAYRRSDKPLQVSLATDGDDLLMEFSDADTPPAQIALLASAFGAKDLELPELEDERGRGLFLVVTAMQAIVVEDRTGQGGGLFLRGRFVGIART